MRCLRWDLGWDLRWDLSSDLRWNLYDISLRYHNSSAMDAIDLLTQMTSWDLIWIWDFIWIEMVLGLLWKMRYFQLFLASLTTKVLWMLWICWLKWLREISFGYDISYGFKMVLGLFWKNEMRFEMRFQIRFEMR